MEKLYDRELRSRDVIKVLFGVFFFSHLYTWTDIG